MGYLTNWYANLRATFVLVTTAHNRSERTDILGYETIDTIDLDTYISDHIPYIEINRLSIAELFAYKQYVKDRLVIYIAYNDGYMAYIGKTKNLSLRIKQHHAKKAAWLNPQSQHNIGTWLEVLHFDPNITDIELLRYEAILILLYKPQYNQGIFLRIVGERN